MKRQIPIFIAAIVGILMILDTFFKAAIFNNNAATVRTWVVIIATAALALGATNLLRIHSSVVMKRVGTAGWPSSVALLFSLLATIAIGLTVGRESTAYSYFYDGIMQPGAATAFSLLAFFIASAAVRSFRARSVESTLLLITAIIIMLGNAPIGNVLIPGLPSISSWITRVPSAAAQRGLILTAAIAFIAISLRNILGFSTEWLGGSKD